jgi:Fe-S-cluster-containing dehydrogenase component
LQVSKPLPNKKVSGPKKYGMVVDPARCFNCMACVVSCQMENGVPLGHNRNWIKTGRPGDCGPFLFQPGNCMQCDEPSCVAACPVGATYKGRDGRVLIDPGRCISCGNCVTACPYGARYLHKARKRADKCDFCEARLAAGLEPACVVTCPTQARVFGDLNDPESRVSRILKTEKHFSVRNARVDTKPNIFYLSGKRLQTWPREPSLPGGIFPSDQFWKKY